MLTRQRIIVESLFFIHIANFNRICYNCSTKIKIQFKTKMKKKVAFFGPKSRKIIASINIFMFLGVFLFPQLAFASIISDEKIIELTNLLREKQGLNTLNANQLLTKAAFDKADSIFEEQVFGHTINGQSFSTWVKNTGYDYKTVGENLAIDFVSSEGAMKAWMDSPSHKKNVLNPEFKEIGIAVKNQSFEGKDSILIVQLFGAPKISSPKEILTEENSTQSKSLNDPSMFLTHSQEDRSLAIRSNTSLPDSNPFISNPHPIYGSELVNLKIIEQVILLVFDNTQLLLVNYYYSAITFMLLFFSSAYIWQRKISSEHSNI